MDKKDIVKFIEEMSRIGDEWTEEQVEDVYKGKTLKEALNERHSEVGMFLNSLATAFLRKEK